MAEQPARTLARTLGFTDLVLIVIGTVIGSGIFVVPATVLASSGGAVGTALLVWLVAGILSLLGALTYGELGAANPDAGGLYVYIRDAFGAAPAVPVRLDDLLRHRQRLGGDAGVAFTGYLGQFMTVTPAMSKVVAVLVITVLAVMNVRGTRQSVDGAELEHGGEGGRDPRHERRAAGAGQRTLSGTRSVAGDVHARTPVERRRRDGRRPLGLRRMAVRHLLGR